MSRISHLPFEIQDELVMMLPFAAIQHMTKWHPTGGRYESDDHPIWKQLYRRDLSTVVSFGRGIYLKRKTQLKALHSAVGRVYQNNAFKTGLSAQSWVAIINYTVIANLDVALGECLRIFDVPIWMNEEPKFMETHTYNCLFDGLSRAISNKWHSMTAILVKLINQHLTAYKSKLRAFITGIMISQPESVLYHVLDLLPRADVVEHMHLAHTHGSLSISSTLAYYLDGRVE